MSSSDSETGSRHRGTGSGSGTPTQATTEDTRGMILTVTPNPSLDRTYEVPALDRGEVLRATGERMDPGGKGVNVSRAVAAHAAPPHSPSSRWAARPAPWSPNSSTPRGSASTPYP